MRAIIEQLESRQLLSLAADANDDHVVDTLDFQVVAVNFNHAADKAHGDFTGDGKCNALDFNVLADEFGAVEMSTKRWAGGDSGAPANLDEATQYIGGVAPVAGDIISITPGDLSNFYPTGLGSVTACTGLILDNGGNGDSFDFLSGLTVNGDAAISNCDQSVTLGALSGNLTGTGNTGGATVTNKTGTGKTVNYDGGLEILNLGTAGTAASISVGNSQGYLLVDAAAKSDSSITFTSTSQGGSPALGSNDNLVACTIVANKTSGACNLSLSSQTLPAAATLTSQLNGVTKIDGTGGTHKKFTQLRASGQQAKYATVTGGVEGSHARLSSISGTYDGSFGFNPEHPGGDYTNFVASGGTSNAETYSFTIADSATLGSVSITLIDETHESTLNLDTITVTAAASTTVPQARLGIRLGIGI